MPSPLLHPVAAFPGHRFGLAQPRGDVSADSTIYTTLVLVTLPEWEPGFREVWDFRFTATFEIGPSAIARLRDLEVALRDELAGSETILITGGRPLIAYAARFYDRLLRPYGRSARACRSREEALGLLGADRVPDLNGRAGSVADRVSLSGLQIGGEPSS